MLTRQLPTIQFINGTKHIDAFALPGEEIDVRHLCEDGVRVLFGSVPPLLTPIRVELTARYLINGQKAQLPDVEAGSHEERQGSLASG